MPKRLKDQVIVITGASSGIGLVTATTAARAGAKVVLAARNERDLNATVEQIRRAGGDAIAVPADVTVFEDVEALARAAVSRYGRIDTWVNNAGISVYAPFVEVDLEDARRIMDVNFMGQVYGAKAALPHLERTGGALVCVGSALSDRGIPLQGIYCASKHALKGWLDSLRVELRKAGSRVRVTLIKPSSINTPLFNKAKTQLGVMPRPIDPIYEPELAARAILRAATGRERDAFVGGGGKFLSVAERISPRLLDVHQTMFGFDAQKSDWPKSADAPSNVYEPVVHDGGPRGDFGREAGHRSPYQAIEGRSIVASLAAGAALGLVASGMERSGRSSAATLVRAAAAALIGKGLITLAVDR